MAKYTAEEIRARFLALFDGYTKAHGIASPTGKVDEAKGNKKEVRCRTVKSPLTPEKLDEHFMGEKDGIGIVPLRDDNKTLKFAVIDIDDYKNMDIPAIIRRCKDLNLPLIPFLSKSAGLHLTLFLEEPIEAAIVTAKLEQWAAVLGYPGCEVFPKQTSRADHPDDVGNWINMPYYDARNRFGNNRVALGPDGEMMTIIQFLDYAETMLVTYDQLISIETLDSIGDHVYFTDGPMCLRNLYDAGGVDSGGRNEALYNCAVYRRRADPDHWETKLHVDNDTLMKPPLPSREVEAMIKHFRKGKNDQFKCSVEPMQSQCNKALCKLCKFGVGPGIGNLTAELKNLGKLQGGAEPLYFLEVGGVRIHFCTDDLLQQHRFQKRVFEEKDIVWDPMKPGKWRDVLRNLLERVEISHVPEEMTLRGQFDALLSKFFGGIGQTTEKQQITSGHPWYDSENKRVLFQYMGLKEFLKTYGFRVEQDAMVWQWIKDRGGESIQVKIKDKNDERIQISCWQVPHERAEDQDLGALPEFNTEVF